MPDPIQSGAEIAKAISQPFTELVKGFNSAVGVWFEPHRIVRRAKAEREAELEAAKGQILSDIQKARGDGVIQEIRARARGAAEILEIERQQNLEQIVGIAHESTSGNSSPPIDRDWLRKFALAAQDVSDEGMQEVWGKVLAGERDAPGSLSLRAMQILGTMNRHDAQCLENVLPFLWNREYFFSDFAKSAGFDLPALATWSHLVAIGLALQPAHGIVFTGPLKMSFGERFFLVTFRNNFARYLGHHLTEAGQQIGKYCAVTPNYDYLSHILERSKQNEKSSITFEEFSSPKQASSRCD